MRERLRFFGVLETGCDEFGNSIIFTTEWEVDYNLEEEYAEILFLLIWRIRMKALKTISSLVLVSLAVLGVLVLGLMGCDDDCTSPNLGEYQMQVGGLQAQNQISVGDTLWVTFTDIPLQDGCHSFLRIETRHQPNHLIYELIGFVREGTCPLVYTEFDVTIPVVGLEAGTHQITVGQPDNNHLQHNVEVIP